MKNENKLSIGSKAARITVFTVNILIVAAIAIASVTYFVNQSNYKYRAAKNTFSYTINTMEKLAYSYLRSEQTFCNNWATYINGGNMTVYDALEFTDRVCTRRVVMSHIIDYSSLKGYSTQCGPDEKNEVDYSDNSEFNKNFLRTIEDCTEDGIHPHITRPYINPINGVNSIGFCHDIELVNESGGRYHALLVMVVPFDEIKDLWVFPAGYNGKAELAMIDADGKFVIQTQSMSGEDFFDFIQKNHGLNDDQKRALKKSVEEGTDGLLEYKSADGGSLFYAYHEVEFNKDWMLVGYIARDDMNIAPVDITIAEISIIGFLLIILVDGGYILVVNRKLKQSMEETKLANEAKTRFLSSMSHDIRTPMNAIVGMTAIATRRIDDKEQVKECLDKITLASNHLLTLINDVLDISKVESGKFSLNPIVFSLAETLNNLVNVIQPQVKAKELEFDIRTYNITNEYVYADELRINQIFINLLSNAVKYTPMGGRVVLDVEEQPSSSDLKNVKLIFKVSDTGIGMSDEFMKHMYETFTRDDPTRVSGIQGTGLGLAITKQMIDLMKGNIEVNSRLGKGTTFVVTIDVPIAEKMTEDFVLPPMRLLVIDDDEVFLKSSADTIRSLGIDADIANSGNKAIEMIAQRRNEGKDYACIFVDWKMPEPDGLATAKMIREKFGKNIPVIIMSSYDRSEIEEEASEAGVNGFVGKPLFRSTIYNKMNDLLNFDKGSASTEEENTEILKGANILVAEDNDINWDIIEAMMSFCGATTERAENGKICVEMLSKAPEGKYSAVLMDVQMPVMDGRTAARAIRASENEYVKNIPIIAMTADAFAEDIRSCLDAGMNGHVAKPLDMKMVLKEINKVLRPE